MRRIFQRRSFAAFVAPLFAFIALGVACGDTGSSLIAEPPPPQQNTDSNANDASANTNNGGVDSGNGPASDAMDKSGPPAATPTFSPAAGTYNTFHESFCLDIASSTPLATIHYTTDGSAPTIASPIFTKRFEIKAFATLTVQAIAVSNGFANSFVGSAKYEILNKGMLGPVGFAPASGQYPVAVDINLNTTTTPAIVCYTTDTSTPSCSPANFPVQEDPCNPHPTPATPPRTCTGTSQQFQSGTPIHIEPTPSGVTVTAVACPREGSQSDITSATYTFQ